MRDLPVWRITAAATGVLLGMGVGVLIAHGRWWPLVAVGPLGLSLVPLVRALAPRDERARVGAAIALSFALHVAAAVLLYTGSVAVGRGGFIPGDDIAYADVSTNLARFLKGEDIRPGAGPPYWGGNAYLIGTFVYFETAIFYVLGPEVLVPILFNTVFALAAALLACDIARRLFDRRSAFVTLCLLAFYPSLVLWSSLNLKDALALLLSSISLWAIVRFHQRPRWWPLLLALVVLFLIHSLRPYLFLGLALLVPLVVGLTPRLDLLTRARWAVVALLISGSLVFLTQSGVAADAQLLQVIEEQRYALGVGARTRYVGPPPVKVNEGDTFVVAAAAAATTSTPGPEPSDTPAPGAPTPTAAPTAEPAVVHVAPNAHIVVLIGSPTASGPPGTVYVRPGDIVVVGTPDRTPEPPEARSVLSSAPDDGTTLAPSQPSANDVALGSIRYLPIGLAFSLFGPFPWLLERTADLLVLPEMLIWYLSLGAAFVTTIRERRRWQLLAPIVLMAVGLLGLFAMVEGNWGTLLRHRSMVIPWVLLLSSPSIIRAFDARVATIGPSNGR